MIITLDTKIKDLYNNELISVRTYNGLRYEGYVSLKDIQEKHTNLTDLLRIRNFGKKSLYELAEVFKLVPPIKQEDIDASDFSKIFYAKFGNLEILSSIEKVICESYETYFNVQLSSLSLIKENHLSGISLFYNLFSDCQYFFRVYPSLTYNENIEIRKILYSFLTSILVSLTQLEDNYKIKQEQLYKSGLDNLNVIAEWKNFKKYLLIPLLELCNYIKDKVEYISDIDKFTYFLTPIQKELFEKECRIALSKASVRTSNVVNKYLTNIHTIVGLIENPIQSLSGSQNLPAVITRKSRTNLELTQILLQLKDKFDEIFQLDESTIQMFRIKRDYPFLIKSQRLFVIDYLNKFGYLPVLYILYNYLRAASSDNKNIKIYCLYYGILTGSAYSLEEIADEVELTFERVRQIKNQGVKLNSKLKTYYDVSNYTHLLNKPFFFSDDLDYLDLLEKERLNLNFNTFAGLLRVISPHSLVQLKEIEVIQRGNLFKDNSLQKIIDNILSLATKRKGEDEIVKISSLVPKITSAKKELLIRVLEKIKNPNIDIKDNEIIFKQNHIDPKIECIKILEEHGSPMFLQEIFDRFKEKFPNHKYTLANQLRTSMRTPIKPIGKQSKYGLEYWDNIFWGSIRDLIVECLEKSETPIHINDLTNNVLVHYPNTNLKNIASTMSSDEFDRFVQYEGGYFGLEDREYSDNYIKAPTYHRYKFEDRLQQFKEFVDTYKRFPLSNSGEMESSLQRWYYNVSNGVLDITNEQFEEFNSLVSYYENKFIPRTGYEVDFFNNCNDYKSFIKTHHILPNRNDGTELYYWLIRSKENFNSYTDFRRIYFADLLSYISSFGFSI